MKDLEGEGSKIIATGTVTDKILNYYGWGNPDKILKYVVCKGHINDWCIYLESMEEEQNYQEVKDVGNKVHGKDRIKFLVNCDDEVLERYRK